MNTLMKLAVVGVVFSFSFVTGCATGNIDPADRDTTGNYDGVWIGTVAGPRADKEILPGNWTMSCEWKPFEIYLVVDDGRVQLGKLETKTPVSTKGLFRIALDSGAAGMTGGIISGNSRFLEIFSGNLSGGDPRGKYSQYISSLGGNGCSAKIKFRRYTADAA